MSYEAKDYSSLLNLKSLSKDLLEAHFALYQGYVKNSNLVIEESKSKPLDQPVNAELKRRLGWEFNGMRLHELFFENLKPEADSIENHPDIFNKINLDFGSFENWQNEFRAMCLMRGIGWVVLYHDRWEDKLLNVWINEHDSGHLSGCRPLLVVDMFEHAYLPDNLRKPDYVDAILSSLDWNSAEQRMKATA